MSLSKENNNEPGKREVELFNFIREEEDLGKIKEALDELEELAELKKTNK